MSTVIFSRICALGRTYDLFPVSELPRDSEPYLDRRDSEVDTAFLLPCESADAEIVVVGEDTPSASASLAAAMFLCLVRGLPLDETDILSRGKIYKVTYDEKNDEFCVLVQKCKLLLSNIAISVNGIPLSVDIIGYGDERLSVSECSDAEHFSVESLRRIYTELRSNGTSGALAFSISGTQALARGFFPYSTRERTLEIACAVASMPSARRAGDLLKIQVGDTSLYCRQCGQSVAISGERIAPLTLAAPDIF